MLDLTGKTLQVEIPISALTMMGHIEETENIQSFFEKIILETCEEISLDSKNSYKDIMPFISNALFMPLIITKMIEENVVFSEAVELCKIDIKKTILDFTLFLKDFENDNSLKSFFKIQTNCIVDAAKKTTDGQLSSSNHMFNISLKNISYSFYKKIEISGLFMVSNNISNKESIRKKLDENLVIPLKESICNALKSLQKDYDIDDDTISKIRESLYLGLDIYYTTFPLQTVLSLILSKCITENINFSDAVSTSNFKELEEKSIEKLEIFNNTFISEIQEMYENLLKNYLSLYFTL